MLMHYVISAGAGGRYNTDINRVIALTARKAHQLCIDEYLESYGLPFDTHIYTRTLFESDNENEAIEYLNYLLGQLERNSVGFQEPTEQRR